MVELSENPREPLVMAFTNNAYHDIINTIGSKHAESGGLLFGYLDDYVVREFVFDVNAQTSGASYTFDTTFLNAEIKRLWNEHELACIGFIHSHPWGSKFPSGPDMWYFKRMFNFMPREKYLVPIVSTIPDGGFNLNPCILFEGNREVVVADNIDLVTELHYSKYKDLCSKRRTFYSFNYNSSKQEDLVDVQKEDSDKVNLVDEPVGDGFPPDLNVNNEWMYREPDFFEITGEVLKDVGRIFKDIGNEVNGFFKNFWRR